MKTRSLWFGLLFLAGLTSALASSRRDAWKQVDDAVNAGLPQTAIERLEPIIAAAAADHAYAEMIKALGWKCVLAANVQGNKPEEKILRLQAELERVPAPARPVAEALLGHWYWHYFLQNRWRYLQRTAGGGGASDDLTTWDLPRILAEIDRHFTAALHDPTALQQTPIASYDPLLAKGTVPDSYRPTLYDFLAHEALSFYQAGELAGLAAEGEFEIDATGPIFGELAEFLAWSPAAPDESAPAAKAVRLYQELLRFHAADADRSAFLDVDLARLVYGQNVALGEEKPARYKAALERFVAGADGHEIQARALAGLAEQLQAEGDFVRAHETARRGAKAFRQTTGGAMCQNVVNELEAPSARLQTEAVWNAPWPTLDVTYRNVATVYFRAVAMDYEQHLAETRWHLGQVGENREKLLASPAVLTWTADLPPTPDYKERTERLPAPTTLRPGFYFILASHDPTFTDRDNQVTAAAVWVSELALALRSRHDDATHSGFVLEAGSGEPVADATVRLWQRDRDGRYQPLTTTRTDANGLFHCRANEQALVFLAEHGGQAVSSLQESHAYRVRTEERDRAQVTTVFFTDRAIYRPGQTIAYKGVSIRFDQAAGKYAAVAGARTTVVFSDPNGQEIARAEHRTNDYGSFSGVFTAPRDRLMGQMSLKVAGGSGATNFSVEEYKRPKFQVELAAPAEAAKLGAAVVVSGKAVAYTGAAIGGAQVKWRVERGVQFPMWCWWWQPPANAAIAHGTAVTDDDGSFRIEFPATPDRAIPAKTEPVFVFNVYADVTDSSGETRSDERAVRAGYTALQAALLADEWQTPERAAEFTVTTQSLDGDPQPAKGTLTLHALQQPATVARGPLLSHRPWWGARGVEPALDPSNPDTWEIAERVSEQTFSTDAQGTAKLSLPLQAGIYRASVATQDRFGRAVTARRTVQVVDPRERRFGVKLANAFLAPKWTLEPGERFTALWGTGYATGRAYVELECNGKLLQKYWTKPGRTQETIELPVTETMRGGFTVRVSYVRENRAYFNERIVTVPWSDRKLAVKWESFRSKLRPGAPETWTAVVAGPTARRAAAEMVAALYDASLDQFLPHSWPTEFGVFRAEEDRSSAELQNASRDFWHVKGSWRTPRRPVEWRYRAFPGALVENVRGWGYPRMMARAATSIDVAAPVAAAEMVTLSAFSVDAAASKGAPGMVADAAIGGMANPSVPLPPKPDLSKVTARRNLNETAFFFPHLVSAADGTVRMTFTMPEALTEWRFLGFAHDAHLRAGFLTDTVVTAKELMVQPNPPRFVREGDAIEFTVKVSNQSEQPQTGVVRLTLADAATEQSADAALGNGQPEQPFELPAKQSRSFSWRITVPDGTGFLTYKAVAASAAFSDGEEGNLPVLSRRVLVTESMPLPIRGPAEKTFTFEKLRGSGGSDTLRHQALTVQMTSQPAWHAVLALPYLMEYPYECSEQVFNRLYANALARHIADSNPKIRRIFDRWKNTPALESPLTKNDELKAVALEETPWLRQANAESQARRNVGLLFDENRVESEQARAWRTLADQQLGDGLWPWFPGGPANEYISLYIVTGFGRLRQLGVEVEMDSALKALGALDGWMAERHRKIMSEREPEAYVLRATDALYLYGRSFFLRDRPLAAEHREAVEFFLRRARGAWLQLDNRHSQGHLALALRRFGDADTAGAIVRSLKERSVVDEELGRFWRDREFSWWWYRAPIETQALMIEVFAEVAEDATAVEECQTWLLKQKQTQDWRTTKATADAIYGLLLRGTDLLGSDAIVEVALGGEIVKPDAVEPGTGFYERRFAGGEVRPTMGDVTVKKTDRGVSWGSVHWQYLEDIAKVTPHADTPLQLRKTLFVKETGGKGQALRPLSGALAVGDELVVRIELRTDRDMEFVHLKDQRGSGTEPVNVLSRYRYQDGLAYYESTRDTASHFFIDYLPKGTYVFEYPTRVQLRGRYQSGIAEIQCLYAPEFNSHSESLPLVVE